MRRVQVLLVHGDDAVAERVAAVVSGTEFELHRVRDGVAALAALAGARPDVVITDLVLPRLDGVTLLRALQARADTRRLPVLILTGRWSAEEAMRALAAGARHVVCGPFQPEDLLHRLRRAVAGPAADRSDAP